MSPLVPVALGFCVGVGLLQAQAELPAPGVLAVLVGTALAMIGVSNLVRPTAARLVLWSLAAAALGLSVSAGRAAWRLEDRLDPAREGVELSVTGTVASLPQAVEHGIGFEFAVDTAPSGVPPRLQLAWYQDRKRDAGDLFYPVHPGERWRFVVKLKRPYAPLNPHTFDYEAYLFEQGLGATGYVRERAGASRLPDTGLAPLLAIERLREGVRERFNATLAHSPWRGVLVALAVGDQRGIPPEQWTLYTRTGISHLVSISGPHIIVWALIAGALSGWVWRRVPALALRIPAQRAAVVFGLLATTFYCALSGWGVPAQRSLVMLAVSAVAVLGGRRVAPSAALSLALLAVLLWDPWAVLGRGFWLSFGAVAVLLLAGTGRLVPPSRWREWASAQWAVTVGLAPVLLALTGQVSLVSPLANAVAIPFVSALVLPLTLAYAVLPWAPLAHLAAWLWGVLAVFLSWLARPEWAVWQQPEAPLAWAVLAALGVLWSLLPRGVPGRLAALLLCVPLLVWRPPRPAVGTFELTLLDVGQGLSATVKTAGHDLVFDTGPRTGRNADAGQRVLVPYLRGEGVTRLSGVIVSHDDSDHSGGAASLVAALHADWLMGALRTDSPVRALPVPQRSCQRGEHWEWDGVRFEVLHPAPGAVVGRDTNLTSCVLRVSGAGGSALLTGDIPARAEAELQALGLLAPTTVVVAPHHGSHSASSAEFIAATRPRWVVFTVGYRSRFGHPHPEVVARYRAAAAEVLRTDRDGAVRLIFEPAGLTITRWREQARRYWHSPFMATVPQ